ncbi:lymphocyte expansion molecule isoform X2 [Esox lucius]|uniref:lymphocyte expansion molecule isoform X2 n=1 Tax=Esox lucius TaxID=8010 RepID=UPI0014771908|nr:lymphocyte expansion molecule isoform X2 [Esox lucius]
MAEKKFKGAPFGTQMARFDVSAVHPANKRAGTYTEIPYCKKMTNELERRLGPGSYDVASHGDFSVRSVSERAKGLGWQRAQETARLAAICNPFQRGAWESKRFLTTKLGPGSYRTGDFIEKLQKKPGSVRGVCDTREERFRKAQSCTPGPGCYGKGGVPWAALEEKRVGSNRATNMHFSSSLKRFPEASATDSGLSPCTYTLKSSTELLLASGTSKRGPYDLFTGSRDKPITGFYAVPGTVGPGRYNIAGKGQSKKAKCPTSSFSSRTQRYLHTPERDKYAQERLRAVNVPVDRRSFLVPPRRDLFMTAA